MSIGEKLCNARLAKKESTSEVAAATRMKVQTVEAIEQEDFAKIPAPIYAKGFIKLYAEHVGLDPAPLVAEYVARFARGSGRSTDADGEPRVLKVLRQSEGGPSEDEDVAPQDDVAGDADLFDHAVRATSRGQRMPSEDATKAGTSAVADWFRDLMTWLVALPVRLRGARGTGGILNDWAARVSGLGWRAVVVVAGVLVLLAVVTAAVSQWRRPRADVGTVTSAPGGDEVLRLAIEPPDPYLD